VVDAGGDLLSAAGGDVVVFADDSVNGELDGETGLAAVRQIARAGTGAPFVLAGPKQTWLIGTAVRELKLARDRVIGTASSAIVGSVAALTAVALGRTGVSASVVGRPPGFVIAWSAASIDGVLVTELLPPHRLLAISNGLSKLWPPGPQAIAAATTEIVEALIAGSRRVLHATTILDGELGLRDVAAMLPLEIDRGRVTARLTPSLTPQERTELLSTLTRSPREAAAQR
jgi:hypothetical protein